MNAKQYREERDAAQQAVATLAGELARCYTQIENLQVNCHYWRRNHNEACRTRDIAKDDLRKALANGGGDTYGGGLRNSRQEIDRLQDENEELRKDVAIVEMQGKDEQDRADAAERLADIRLSVIRAWSRACDRVAAQRDAYKAEAQQERDNPYYKNLVKECDDLRTINAHNKGPIWTQRLHDLVRGNIYSTFVRQEDIIDSLAREGERLNKQIEQLVTDLKYADESAAKDKAHCVRTIDQLSIERRALESQKSNLQNRLQCALHNGMSRTREIHKLRRDLSVSDSKLRMYKADRQRLYETYVFPFEPNEWDA